MLWKALYCVTVINRFASYVVQIKMDQIATYLPGILLAHAAFLLAIMSPGPNILAVIGTSMGAGRRPGMALALGVATGTFCWASLTLVGLTALLTAYASIITIIKIIGGTYLLWLGFKAFRSAASAQEIKTIRLSVEGKPVAYFLRGLTVQMTNPKAVLSWVAIMSLGLQSDAPLWVGASIVLGTSVLSVAGHLVYAVAFSTRTMVVFYKRARRWIEVALGAFFSFAGIKLLTDRS